MVKKRPNRTKFIEVTSAEIRTAIEMNRMEVKFGDLPDLAFIKILSYLSLEDRIRSRQVSRGWKKIIDSIKMKSLCFSGQPIGCIYQNHRLVSGAFAQNFVSSPRFEPFFDMFGSTIFSNLKRLRLLDLPDVESRTAFAQTLRSFRQLEELSIIRSCCQLGNEGWPEMEIDFELNLPMLNKIQLDDYLGVRKLTLNAPKLKDVEVYLARELEIVHSESVERLSTIKIRYVRRVDQLKNLRYFYCRDLPEIDSTFLCHLEKLKEIHVESKWMVRELFEQRQRYGRADLKIYLRGLLLSGPDDPWIEKSDYYRNSLFPQTIRFFAENLPRLTDEIPGYIAIPVSAIEHLAKETQASLLKRFTDLFALDVDRPVKNIGRLLNFLRRNSNITFRVLYFYHEQPHDLFNPLPEHFDSEFEELVFYKTVPDFSFLPRLKSLNTLVLNSSLHIDLVRKILEELPFLELFKFYVSETEIKKRVRVEKKRPKIFKVELDQSKKTEVSDVNAVIEFIVENSQ